MSQAVLVQHGSCNVWKGHLAAWATPTCGNSATLLGRTRGARSEIHLTRHPAAPHAVCRATTSLLSAALGPGSSDVESAASTGPVPAWVQKAERVRVEMTVVKDRLVKLKE